MNKELMLFTAGIGIGALAFTDQGRKMMNTITGSKLLPSLTEGDSANTESRQSGNGNSSNDGSMSNNGTQSTNNEQSTSAPYSNTQSTNQPQNLFDNHGVKE